MKSLRLGRYALAIGAAAALLPGCGGSQPPIAAPGAMPQSHAVASHAGRGASWMSPSASGQNLLYVSDGARTVYVYSYPAGQLVGTLTGFIYPLGECVDLKGDVFIVAAADRSDKSGVIYEYAHGGTSPIATLSDPGPAVGCSVNPSNGDLAVSGSGVAVFAHATGAPTIYPSSAYVFYYCGYDNHGNLYLSGFDAYANQDELLRLSRGSISFDQIVLSKNLYASSIFWPSVQWDGKHITVSSASNGGRGPVSVYRLAISGSDASIVGTTMLSSKKNRYSGQLLIQGNAIVGFDYDSGIESASRWTYPRGGHPRKTIAVLKSGIFWGIALSEAPLQATAERTLSTQWFLGWELGV